MSNVATENQLPSAPPPVETPEQRKARLLAKVRILRQNQINGTAVQGDPKKQYMWVNTREERQTFFQSMGWALTKDKNVKTQWAQADGTHKRADLILYEIDRDLYEAFEADKELRSVEALESAEKSFETSAARNGAPTFRPRA